jgi:hypothetical protein
MAVTTILKINWETHSQNLLSYIMPLISSFSCSTSQRLFLNCQSVIWDFESASGLGENIMCRGCCSWVLNFRVSGSWQAVSLVHNGKWDVGHEAC